MEGQCQGNDLEGMLGTGRLNVYKALSAGVFPSLSINEINYLNDTDRKSLGIIYSSLVSAKKSIINGESTKNDIRNLFGSPWLSGINDGELTWTYGNYDYSLFGKNKAKDLVV